MLACFNNQLLRFGGDLAVGSMTILFSLLDFIYLPISGISKGAQPILSYNYGAGRYDRVRRTLRLSLIVGTGFSLIGSLFMMTVPRPYIALFTSDLALLDTAAKMLPVYIAGNCVLGANTIFQQSYNALDEGIKSFFFAFFRKMILLIPLLYILPAALPKWGV
ncbi:MAG: MATE family efflux transporter, partial [Acutalibacter sp.]|nr:MATE family efflux transporter [Acutalibacter sp.]